MAPNHDRKRLTRPAQRRDPDVAATPSQTAGGWIGSRPQPPQAVARSASLEAGQPPEDLEGLPRRLTRNTVAQEAVAQ